MKSVVCTARSATTCSYVRPSPITPTERTGRNTANACAVRSYHDVAARVARLSQLVDEDGVGAAQQIRVLARHGAQDPHAKARARERMAKHHLARQSELPARARALRP